MLQLALGVKLPKGLVLYISSPLEYQCKIKSSKKTLVDCIFPQGVRGHKTNYTSPEYFIIRFFYSLAQQLRELLVNFYWLNVLTFQLIIAIYRKDNFVDNWVIIIGDVHQLIKH